MADKKKKTKAKPEKEDIKDKKVTEKNDIDEKTEDTEKKITKKDKESRLHAESMNAAHASRESPRDRSILIVATIFIAMILILSGLMYSNYTENKAIEECLVIQNHPDLGYPCVCYPSEKPKDIDAYIDQRTEKYCRCDCDLGNNQTYTAHIIRAKD